LATLAEEDGFVRLVDDRLGYSLSFSDEFVFEPSREPHQETIELVEKVENPVPATIGKRFTLLRFPKNSVDFNPNLNCVVQYVPEYVGEISNKWVADESLKTLKANVALGSVSELEKIDMNGFEFYRFTVHRPDAQPPDSFRFYSHLNVDRRLVFTFTLTAPDSEVDVRFGEFEKVLGTVEFW